MNRALKSALSRYIRENFDDLLALDLKIARMLGVPAPHTLSSWAYYKSPFWTKFIDFLAWHILDQKDHCKGDFERVTKGAKGGTVG